MMLLLAVTSDASTVYEHAIQHFDPQDVAEAFAATRGVTIPRQLQKALADVRRKTGSDILEEFRSMGPDCPPIHIQRWSARRLASASLLFGGSAILAYLLIDNLSDSNFF